MSNRTIRIAELVQRELGSYLHTKYKQEAVAITVADVEVAPDLKTGKIYFSILGDEATVDERFRWLLRKRAELRKVLAQRIKIKFAPDWVFLIDQAVERGNRVLDLLDDLAREEKAKQSEEDGDA
ncbi:30S ribosome-binding factor RbfA [Actomonas aquatica]|uniref:Ribosome-binding factor A n=1 Tax=Actomonas aquatica TaxID=2866162 RepID=A0ABZ1C8P3_9BACT|nr:30S ribosome-binding factor RbfA [Opitutus sp. WL0086]WRQ87797.1 30S ribosome-binding factor RbfA [Opitutus sp. WL0086]